VDSPGLLDVETGEHLARAATLLARHVLRDSDVVAELGSGHFGIVANATEDGARSLADMLIEQLRGFDFTLEGDRLEVSLAFGISMYDEEKTAHGLLEEARAALRSRDSRRELQGSC
jgi:GGDEF domain-containing protein